MKEDRTSKKLWIILAAYFVLSVLLFDPKLNTGGDNARYVILGEALSHFQGFVDLQTPGQPPHTQYPFGFPLLLVPWLWVFGRSFVLLKMVPLLCGLGAFVFFGLLMRRLLGKHYLWPALIFATTPILIEYNHWLFSEMPFLLFSLGALYFFMRRKERIHFLILAGGAAVYSYFIRTAGITLVLAFLVALAWRREWRNLIIVAAIAAVPIALWQYRNGRVVQEWSYIDQLLSKDPYNPEAGRIDVGGLLARLKTNLFTYLFSVVGQAFLPVARAPFFSGLVGLVFFAAVVYGLVIRIRHLDVIDWYVLFSLAVLLIWPSVWSGDRFLLPVMPLLLFYLFLSMGRIFEKVKLRWGMVAAAVLFVVINAVALVPGFGRGLRTPYPVDYQRYFDVCKWVGRNTPPGSVVVARKPEFVYLMCNRQSMLYPFSYDRAKVLEAVTTADYVIVDNFMWTATSSRYLVPAIDQRPDLFELVYQTVRPEFYLLRVLK